MTRRKALLAGSVSKSPMCWLMKTFSPTASATEFFKCAPTARTISEFRMRSSELVALCAFFIPHSAFRTPHLNGQRRVAARPAQNHFAVQHHADNRIIHVPDNRAVVNEKKIGDAAAAVPALRVRRCKSARRSNCRWWRRREISIPPSANDAADSTAASRRDWDCREQSEFASSEFGVADFPQQNNRRFRRDAAAVLPAAKLRRRLSRFRAMETSARTAFLRDVCVRANVGRLFRCAHPPADEIRRRL